MLPIHTILRVDGNRPFAEDEGGEDHGTEPTYKMIVEALISMTDPWMRAFDDREARVSQHSTRKQARIGVPGQQRAHLEKPCMTQDQAISGYICPSHPHCLEVSIKECEWTVLMKIIRDSFNENDSLMMQHIAQARASKNKRNSKVRRKVGGKKNERTPDEA